MEIKIKTTGSGRKAVEAAVERLNGKLAPKQRRGEVSASINDSMARSFKCELEAIDGVVEYSVI